MLYRYKQRFYLLAVMTLGAVTLAGCVGKKYGFPGFGAKQASKSEIETEKLAPVEKNASQEKKPSDLTDLNHVASSDATSGASIHPTSASLQRKLSVDSSTGVSRIADASGLPSINPASEIDEAFREILAGDSEMPQKQSSQELENYKELVSQVDNGASSLDALKASLEKLNENNIASSSPVKQNGETFAQYISSQKQPEIVRASSVAHTDEEIPGVVELSDAEATDKANFSLEFPWLKASKNSEKNETESTSPEEQLSPSGLGHIRGMLTKARELIQENNLLDARIIAETASVLKKKTQAAFLPEEITPEQILAEIAERERQRKELLLAGLESNTLPKTSGIESEKPLTTKAKPVAPVVIDLSKEWLNNAKSTGEIGQDDIIRFDQSIARSNQAARLPTITPAGQQYIASPANRPIERTSYNSPENGHREKNTTQSPNSNKTILLLEEAPKSESVIQEESTSEPASSLPPVLYLGEETSQIQSDGQTLSDAGSLPLLIMPGMNSGKNNQQDADFDEFAADFAGMGIEGTPEIEEAPLLIDEAELRIQSARLPQISTTTISLIVCGFVFGAFMLIRWRR